jgi:hypothetical protein
MPVEVWTTNIIVLIKALIYKTGICNRLKEVMNTSFMDEW